MDPCGAVPISVALSKETDLKYTGFFVISDSTPTGNAYAVFSARDMYGNRGTEIKSGRSVNIDTDGPSVTQLSILPGQPVKNDETVPVSVAVTFGINEVLEDGSVPELSYLLSGALRELVAIDPVIKVETQQGHAETYQAVFELLPDAGLEGPETLQFFYSGADDLDNVSDQVLCENSFQIYQGDLPPYESPQGLNAQTLSNGRIHLSWDIVEKADGYVLYRQAPGRGRANKISAV